MRCSTHWLRGSFRTRGGISWYAGAAATPSICCPSCPSPSVVDRRGRPEVLERVLCGEVSVIHVVRAQPHERFRTACGGRTWTLRAAAVMAVLTAPAGSELPDRDAQQWASFVRRGSSGVGEDHLRVAPPDLGRGAARPGRWARRLAPARRSATRPGIRTRPCRDGGTGAGVRRSGSRVGLARQVNER